MPYVIFLPQFSLRAQSALDRFQKFPDQPFPIRARVRKAGVEMSLAAVPCQLPNTGATGVSMIVIGVFSIAVGLVLTRLTSRKHRVPLTMILVLIVGICATAPHPASASATDCSPSTPGVTWPDFDWRPSSDPIVLDCDNISPDANIGYIRAGGSPDGSFTGYGAYEFTGFFPTYFGFEDARSWINGYLPTSVTHEWQTLSGSTWSRASWDPGVNPWDITGNGPLLDEVFAALFGGTARLLIRATDGTTDQVCAVSYVE